MSDLVVETVCMNACWDGRDSVKEVTPEFLHQSLSVVGTLKSLSQNPLKG